MSIRKLRAGRVPSVTAEQFVGEKGTIFWNEITGTLRLSNGTTAGGVPLQLVSSDFAFSFGDFVASTTGNGAAQLKSKNANQDIAIVSNGTGVINMVGDFHIHRTGQYDPDSNDVDGAVFAVKGDGQIQMKVPIQDNLSGALEIIGNDTGLFVSPNQTGVILHVTGNSGLVSRNYFDANQNYALLVGRRYNGTQSAPTKVLSGEQFFRIAGQAAGQTASEPAVFQTFGPAQIDWVATEDQGPNNQGAEIKIRVTPNGSNSFTSGIYVATFNATTGLTAIKFNGPLTGNVTGKADTAGNADTVTHGVYTTDTGTVTNTMLAGSIANNKLANSSITVNGSTIALGGTATVTAAAGTLTGTTLASNIVTSSLTTVGTLGSLAVTGAVQAGSLYGKLYRTVRDAGTIGAGGTLTIDFSSDAIVYCVWGDGLNIAYQNYVVGRVVKVMAIKSAGTGTDSISLDGVTAGQVSSGGTTVTANAGATVFMEFISTTTSVGGVFIKL